MNRNLQEKENITLQLQTRLKKIPSEYSEAETRIHLIDAALREAGWDNLQNGRDLEYLSPRHAHQ